MNNKKAEIKECREKFASVW